MKSLTFRDFIDLLKTSGELHSVPAEVDPDQEIAALTARVCKSRQNRALLFDSVKGSSFRAATNLFGSERRIRLALGLEKLPGLTDRLDRILEGLQGGSATEKLQSLTTAPEWSAATPTSCAPPAELQTAVSDLNVLPIIKNHPLDGQPVHSGRFLSLPLVITADPQGKEINCGMYRAGVTAPDRLAISWSSSSGAALHRHLWAAKGEPMPVTIALGSPPALIFAATLPLPLDEFTFAGLLQGAPLKTFGCSNGLAAPLDSEIVIEGYLEPESCQSGFFGNHSGFYTPSEPAASLKITSIKLRSDMILPATVVGRPPMEDCWLARAGGYLLLSLLKVDVPQVVALHQPFAGIFHGAVFISLKNIPGQGRELITAIRTTPWFAGSKLLVVVDDDQDPADEAGVLWRIMNCVNWAEDMIISAGRLSIDATGKASETRAAVREDARIEELVEKRWKEYGFE